jgi:hypothetical protein
LRYALDETPETLMLADIWQPLAANNQQLELLFGFRLEHDEEALHVDQALGILLSDRRPGEKEDIAPFQRLLAEARG